jgi:hypothetical protein
MYRIRKLITGIKNLIYYFRIIWNDMDYDYYYILFLIFHKLKKTQKRYTKKDFFENQENELNKPLRICIEIIYRMLTDFYYNDIKNYDKIIDNKHLIMAESCLKRDHDLLFKILSKYIKYWWD